MICRASEPIEFEVFEILTFEPMWKGFLRIWAELRIASTDVVCEFLMLSVAS
jgi:hypothetical protein